MYEIRIPRQMENPWRQMIPIESMKRRMPGPARCFVILIGSGKGDALFISSFVVYGRAEEE